MKYFALFLLVFFWISSAAQPSRNVLTEHALEEMGIRIAARHDSLLNSIRLRKEKGLPRPLIGYALSGGGAKGLAHIGAIEVLESEGIIPDRITGTSMGSIVGALYSVGYRAKQMHTLADSMNWEELLLDRMHRTDFSLEEKDEAEAYLLKFGFKGFKLHLPKGIISGQKLGLRLGRLLWSSHETHDFSKLHIPYRAIATDVVTGERVVLSSGFLPDAVRASMAIPTAYSPIEIDGRLLVDGGVVQNFPVEEVKEMGADIIIGVDVGAILYKRDQLTSALAIADQLTSLQIVAGSLRQEDICDVYIRPELNDLSSSDFSKADSLMSLGKLAAEKQRPFFRQLNDTLEKYYPRPKVPAYMPKLKRIYIKEIEFRGLQRVSEKMASNWLKIKTDEWTTIDKLEEGINRLYGTQFFNKIDYKIEGLGKGSKLTIRADEMEYVTARFGLHYDNIFKAGLLMNYTVRNLKTQGSRVMLRVRLSENPGLNLSYRFLLVQKLRMGGNLELDYQTIEFPNLKKTENGYFREYKKYTDLLIKCDLEGTKSNNWRNGFGPHLKLGNIKAHNVTKYYLEDAMVGAHAFYHLDTYDRAFFPKSGTRFYALLDFNHLINNSTKTDLATDYWTAQVSLDHVWPLANRLAFRTSLNLAAQSHHNTSPRDQFSLGARTIFERKVIPFSGVYYGDRTSPSVATAQAKFRYEPWENKFVYAVGNYATYGSNIERTAKLENDLWGIGIGAGFQSIIGPVFVEAAKSSVYKDITWLVNIGFVF